MFNIAQIQACFYQLVGFQQTNDPNYPQLSAALTTSTSGKYIQSTHRLCTLENVYNAAPDFYGYQYPAFDNTKAYAVGVYTTYNNIIYRCKTATAAPVAPATNANPPDDAAHFIVAPLFEDWLTQLYNNSCANLVSELLKYKKLNNVGKSLIESMQLYTGFGMLEDKIIKRGRFCGFQILPSKIQSLLVRIDKIGIQSDTAGQSIRFYLYHSSQVDPINTFDVEIARANSFTWGAFTNCMLSYMKDNQDANGVFYLGYYEDDIEGQVVFKQGNIMSPCASCGGADVANFNKWSKHLEIQAVYVPATSINEDRSLFAENAISYNYDSNFGMNLSLTVMCDLTQFFCTNASIFADALAMQICIDLLNVIAFTTRINAVADKTRQLAMADLDINLKSGSFKAEYISQLMALDYDFSGFDSTCLPCNTRKGITYHAW